jgi:predicted transcriptional regulator
MPYQRYAIVQHKLELRTKALAANIEEIPHLAMQLSKLDEWLNLLKELTAEQARLTAARQEVSKRIAEIIDEAQRLLISVDYAVKLHYGNRSEKLLEYGVKPLRKKPRTRLVGPDGKPLKGKGKAANAEAPAAPEPE